MVICYMWDMILDGKMPWHRRAWFNSHPMIDIFKLIFCVSRVLFIILKKEVMVKYIRERERAIYLLPRFQYWIRLRRLEFSLSNYKKEDYIASYKMS